MLVDTNIVILRGRIDPEELPAAVAISAITRSAATVTAIAEATNVRRLKVIGRHLTSGNEFTSAPAPSTDAGRP